MPNKVELMCLYWSTSGIFPGDGEISRFDFKERVEAAARAGFKGIGIWHTDLEHCTLHRSLKEMKMILDDNDIRYVELEFLTDWFLEGGRKEESDQRKRRLFEASAALNAKHVKVGDFYRCISPWERILDSFAKLCREAEDFGATIGFEMMGGAMVNNLKDAVSMVETVGARNGGLILDIIQIQYLGISNEEVSRIPGQYLIGAELNDGALPGSPMHDPSRARRYCGEGDFDIQGFIRSVQKTGFKGPWAVEVMSKELAVLPLEELAARAFRTTMAEFSG
jgi:sugar phosphate isomerase/epimerase